MAFSFLINLILKYMILVWDNGQMFYAPILRFYEAFYPSFYQQALDLYNNLPI